MKSTRLTLMPAAGLAALFVVAGCKDLPQPDNAKTLKHLPQGWSASQRQDYYHTAQGTEILPYEWFTSLEQIKGGELFRADSNVSRYRLLPDTSSVKNPGRLPVGVVKDVDTVSRKAYLGFTCAACHNGQINYKGTGIRIDGGSGVLDLTRFVEDMFAALAVTDVAPIKFDRFARRALGSRYSEETKTALHSDLRAKLKEIIEVKHKDWKYRLYPTADGFGRQDALGHGGNNGFSKLGNDKNLTVADGPVSYPSVWNALDWDWVQYNGSIRQPMGRNVGEVLGVGGMSVLKGPKKDLYKSSVKLQNLHAIETQLHSLKAPQWPEDILGSIDRQKAKQGAALFAQRCAGCHTTTKDAIGDWKIKLIPLEHIGTDPKQAVNLANHMVDTGDLGFGVIPAGLALQHITEGVAQRKYKELGISPAEQQRMNRGKPNEWKANLAYRAHTLDGIWATPPYLHNGSVPNLYELLSPVSERSSTFHTGNLEYDPVHVGYQKGRFEGGFLFRTSQPGNSNAGHEFRDGPPGKGVIGPKLSPDERMAIIEYLKIYTTDYDATVKGPYATAAPAPAWH